MFKSVKDFIKIISDPSISKKTKKEVNLIKKSILENIAYFREQFNLSADLTVREIDISGTKGAIITIEGMVEKKTLTTSVITPMVNAKFTTSDPIEKYITLRDNILASTEQIQITTFEDAFKLVMSGFALVLVDQNSSILAIGVQGFSFRSISEPSTEMTQRGSREGFVEPIRINMSLIRRRIKNTKMKFEMMSIGSISKTDICLCYLTDRVSSKILKEVKKRLKEINLQTVLEAGYLAPYLEEKKDISLFNSIGTSERPDTVCGKISEGRIAIIIDGTPNVLIVPYLFVEYFQSLDDYAVRPYFATLIRWLKYIAFFVAITLPGMYVAMGTFSPELFPEQLITKIAISISTTPFPLLIETLLILFIYEIMRESGLRLPRTLGHAVSIVGALVIGEAAVNSGLMGEVTLMIVALAAISSYVIPNLYEPIAFLRIVFVLVGGIMGIWGIMLLFCVILVNICSKNNYGIPFSAPISPFNLHSMRDVAIRASWKTLSKDTNNIQNMPGSHIL